TPFALQDLTLTTAEDTALTIDVPITAANLDAVVLIVVTPPSHGTMNGSGTHWTYIPAHDYAGPDTVEIHGSDPSGGATAHIAITVTAVNDAPVASADSLATGFDALLTVAPTTLLANDTDLDSAVLTITAVSAAVHGSVA